MHSVDSKRRERAFRAVPGLLLAAFLLAAAVPAAELTGRLDPGTYTFYDENVEIHDVTLHCATLSLTAAPGTPRGLRVVVFGGSIIVNGPVHANGALGANGIGGDEGVNPTPGRAGQRGCDVILETWPSPGYSGPPVNWSVEIGDPVDLAGGNGGDGGDGYKAYLDEDCVPHGAQNGATAGPGGDGGNFTVLASGDVEVDDFVDASGGNGGRGGAGGPSGLHLQAGQGREGRNGGAGGRLTLRHTPHAPADAILSIFANHGGANGGLSSRGGIGGGGGGGGSQAAAPKPGGNGGSGGAGGDVVFDVNRFSIFGDPMHNVASVNASGGSGGGGGAGGSGGDTNCIGCDDNHWTADGGSGAGGGIGGSGGDGGEIDVTVADDASLVAAHLRSDGGSGLWAGTSGASGTSIAGFCSDLPDCPADYFAFGGVLGAAAGNGGAAGPITIEADNLSVATNASVSAAGGAGGSAVDGGIPGSFCCEPGPAFTGAGSQGGAGGSGGPGADVQLVLAGSSFSEDSFSTCGGDGKDGGDGTWGTPVGPGGVGGGGGTSGDVVVNGTALPDDCDPDDGDDGEQGDNGDAPLCFGS